MRRALHALWLGYLTGRAAIHVLVTQDPIGEYCRKCNSFMRRDHDGVVIVIAFNQRNRPCPVHLAWHELVRAGARP